jgi:hypothetical protein
LVLVGRMLDERKNPLAMNLAVRTGSPVRVTSTTSTMPRPVVISTRRPARVATMSYVRDPSSAATTISTRSPFIARAYRGYTVLSDAADPCAAHYRLVHAALSGRLAFVEAQHDITVPTDADDYVPATAPDYARA